jgi:hypothetical protein
MLAALMIGAHNSVSARAFAASSSGVEPIARTPARTTVFDDEDFVFGCSPLCVRPPRSWSVRVGP